MSTQQGAEIWIDITDCFERKLDGLREHVSQVGDRFEQMQARIRERSRQVARLNNLPFEMAEGYRYFAGSAFSWSRPGSSACWTSTTRCSTSRVTVDLKPS
jgi:LmbE family N-acetylglucosaminyl deacetylase